MDRVNRGLVPGLLVAQALAVLAVVAPMAGRPFFYNEQWRAWHLTRPEMPWAIARDTDAPIAFGYAALTKLASVLLGNAEPVLRLPSLLSLPVLAVVTYLLARRWLGVTAAGLATAALLLGRMVVTFAAELAPYTIEAACTAGALLLWLRARDPGVTARGRWARYAAIAALALAGTPVVLVLAPLFALDLLRAVRAREPRAALPAVAAGLVAAVHLVVYVAVQTSQVHGPYWTSTFLPREPAGFARGVWRGLASWFPNALTGGTAHFPVVPDGEIPLAGPARAVLVAAMVVAIVAGIVAGLRDPAVRPLPVAVLGCLAGQAIGSLAHYWPFGWTRVNTFLLPLLYVLAAVGAVRIGRLLRARVPVYRAAVVAGVVAYGLVLLVGYRQVATVRHEGQRAAYGTNLPRLVGLVRARAEPGDLVVLVHEMTTKGWAFYMDEASGGVRLPPERTVTLDAVEVRTAPVLDLLARYPGARHVYVVGLLGTSPAPMRAVLDTLAAHGYEETGLWREEATGGVRELTAARP